MFGFKKKSNDIYAAAFAFVQNMMRRNNNNRFRTPISRTEKEHASRDLIYACINERAKKVAASQLTVKKRTGQNTSESLPFDHWAVKLLSNPNPDIDASMLFMALSRSIDTYGNMYFHTPVSPELNYPVSMWPLPANRVSVVVNKSGQGGMIAGYLLSDNGIEYKIPEREILHIKILHLDDEIKSLFIGKATITAILNNADLDAEITDYLKRWFANDLNKKVILKAEDEWDPDAWTLFKEKWNAENPKMKVASLLENGLDIANTNENTLQVNFDALDARTTKIMTSVFGLTLGLLTGDYTNRATAEIQEGRFLTNTINPLLTIFEQAFTRHLNKFDSTLVAEYTKWQFDDAEDKRKQEQHNLTYGLTTINEIRKEKGLPPVADGDTVFVPSGIVPLRIAANPPTTGANPNSSVPVVANPAKKKYMVKEWNEETLTSLWKTYAEPTDKVAETLQQVISTVFSELENDVLDNVKSYKARDFQLFNEETWVGLLKKATGDILEEHILNMIVQSLSDVDLTSNDLSDGFSETITEMLKNSTVKITDSIGTIKEELTKLLETNPLSSADEMKDLLRNKFTTLKESRANAIAQTSSNYATGAAQTKTWGVVGFEVAWLSQRDGNVRETHQKADGQVRKDGKFQIGADSMEHPCAGSKAEENVNCRCTCFPVRERA